MGIQKAQKNWFTFPFSSSSLLHLDPFPSVLHRVFLFSMLRVAYRYSESERHSFCLAHRHHLSDQFEPLRCLSLHEKRLCASNPWEIKHVDASDQDRGSYPSDWGKRIKFDPRAPTSLSLHQPQINEMMIIERLESNMGLAAWAGAWAWVRGKFVEKYRCRPWCIDACVVVVDGSCRYGIKSDTIEHIYSYRIVSKSRYRNFWMLYKQENRIKWWTVDVIIRPARFTVGWWCADGSFISLLTRESFPYCSKRCRFTPKKF